jgi:hypothetical protein
MTTIYPEFTLKDALADPLILTLMEADGVNPRRLERSLLTIAAKIAERPAKPPVARHTGRALIRMADARTAMLSAPSASCCC